MWQETKKEVEKLLRDKKYNFQLFHESDDSVNYLIYRGNLGCWIQLEGDEKECTDYQVYIRASEDSYDDLYQELSSYTFQNLSDSVEEMINYSVDMNRVLNSIENKIEQIKELAESINLDYEEFITVNFNFEE